MLKKSIFLVLVAALAASANAEDRLGDACPTNGVIGQVGGQLVSCSDGKLAASWHAGDKQIKLELHLMKGGKDIASMSAHTFDGQPLPVGQWTDRAYVAKVEEKNGKVELTQATVKEGFSFHLLPTLMPDGGVLLDLAAETSEVSFQDIGHGDLKVQFPAVHLMSLSQKVVLKNGKLTVVPFGPLDDESARSQYSLRLLAQLEGA